MFFQEPEFLSFCEDLGEAGVKKECRDRITQSYTKENNAQILAYIARKRAEKEEGSNPKPAKEVEKPAKPQQELPKKIE